MSSNNKKSPVRVGAALLLGCALPLIAMACGSSASSGDDTSEAGTSATNGGSISTGGDDTTATGGVSGESVTAGDGGATTAGGTGNDDGGMSSGGAPDTSGCSHDSDCKLPETTPADCAEAKCEAKKCVYLALDADGDGQRALDCSATDVSIEIQTGADCDDRDTNVNSSEPETCDGKDNDCNGDIDDGVEPSKIPCSTGLGVCQGKGFLACSDGTFSKCNAVLAAQPSSDVKECAGLDTNCNGKVDTAGCVCKSNVDKLTCKQPCGTNYEVTCQADGTWPACDPGPASADYCQDNDSDSYPGACTSYCPSSVPAGWKPAADFAGKASDCDDASNHRYPGNSEVCDGVDNDCNGATGEPAVSCGACGAVACGGSCKAQCPGGYTAQGDGTCLENQESILPIRQDDKVCASFPCFGLKEDYDVGRSCGAGYVRSSVDVHNAGGSGNCSAYFISDDPSDCSIRVHHGANACDCFTCSMTVGAKRRVPQCQ